MKFSTLASSGEQGDFGEEEPSSRIGNKKVLIPVILVVIIAGAAGYYLYTNYEQAVVQTSVVTGKITAVQAQGNAIGPGNAMQGGNPGGLGGGAKSSGLTYVTITVGSTSFIESLPCTTAPYATGQSVQVADQLLRSGQHVYSPDVACRGAISAFKSLHITTSRSSTSSSTTST
jgi:hypothetical protein